MKIVLYIVSIICSSIGAFLMVKGHDNGISFIILGVSYNIWANVLK